MEIGAVNRNLFIDAMVISNNCVADDFFAEQHAVKMESVKVNRIPFWSETMQKTKKKTKTSKRQEANFDFEHGDH